MEQPIQLLDDNDFSNIRQYIECYAFNRYVDDLKNPLEYILRFWNENKKFLFELFGNQLLVEKEVNIEYPEEILIEEMENILHPEDKLEITFISQMYNLIYKLPKEFNPLFGLLNPQNLIHNVYNGDTLELPYTLENGISKRLIIPKGCKIIKILSKIARIFNLDGFEEFRIKHSMVLNKKTFKGTICLSIHPLDYMTMSDNDCEWDSCMSWKEDGDYRLGTVEMMNSPYIVVAYLKSKTNMDLFGDETTEWNNKRWRQLFMVSDKMIFGIKGYPYNDDILTNTVLDYLLELFDKNKPECSFFENEFTIMNRKTNTFFGKSIHLLFEFHAMYNDIYGKHLCYITKDFYDNIENYGSMFSMNLSGQTECIACGDDWSDCYEQLDTEILCCPNCSGVMRCPECGEFTDYDNMREFPDGTMMCSYCFDIYGGYCHGCESSVRNDDLVDIDAYSYKGNDKTYIGSICYCSNCLEENPLEEDVGPLEVKNYHYSLRASNFTDRAFKQLFGIFNKDRIEDLRASD